MAYKCLGIGKWVKRKQKKKEREREKRSEKGRKERKGKEGANESFNLLELSHNSYLKLFSQCFILYHASILLFKFQS